MSCCRSKSKIYDFSSFPDLTALNNFIQKKWVIRKYLFFLTIVVVITLFLTDFVLLFYLQKCNSNF